MPPAFLEGGAPRGEGEGHQLLGGGGGKAHVRRNTWTGLYNLTGIY